MGLGTGEAFREWRGGETPPQPSSCLGSSPGAGPLGRVSGSFARSCSDPPLTEKGQMPAGGVWRVVRPWTQASLASGSCVLGGVLGSRRPESLKGAEVAPLHLRTQEGPWT